MALAMARYVNTTKNSSLGSAYTTAAAYNMYYPTARKTTPLVTQSSVGTGVNLGHSFTLNAAGVWEVSAGMILGAAGTIYISPSTLSSTSAWASSGSVGNPDASVILEADLGTVVYIVSTLTASGLGTAIGDCNYISLLYHGAI